MVLLPQKKNLPVSTMASVKYTVWCAMGNSIHVLHTHHLKSEVHLTIVHVYHHSGSIAHVQQFYYSLQQPQNWEA